MKTATPETGYYGLPVLKKPVWTWQVPTYFFVGGIAGPAAIVAAVANGTLARDAHWIAAGGGLASAALLITDLGRPERFFNMLRVFKPQSPMSVGSWILMAFSSTSAASAMAGAIAERTDSRLPVRWLDGSKLATSTLGAVAGSVLATYAGVLIGSTAIPVWNANARLLPLHFGAAGLGSAASLLELLGHDDASLNQLALAAAAIETAILASLEVDVDPRLVPLKTGASGLGIRLGGLLTGPVPLALRLLGGKSRRWRRAAAVSSLAGSLMSRLAWMAAGRASASDPRVPLDLPPA
jgi:hypothetical protein